MTVLNLFQFRGGFRGRGGFNMPFQGRGAFRGFPRGRPPRGGFRGGWAGFPGEFWVFIFSNSLFQYFLNFL